MSSPYMDPLYAKTAELLAAALQKRGVTSIDAAQVAADFTEPPSAKLGHVAFPCFKYAKALQKKPPEVAQELATELSAHAFFSGAQAAGPYLNLFFSGQTLGSYVLDKALDGALFRVPAMKINPVMIEYSQPNTHKELHVGHMRNLCLGNALVRILRYSGRSVVASTFPGDVGTHVAKCLWYLKYHNKEKTPAEGKGEWLGRMYSLANNKLEDERGTPQEEANRKLLTEILQQLEKRQGEFYELWKETRQWSIALMENLYKWADVKFDAWYWESDVDSASVAWIKDLHKQGLLQESEGAVGLNLEDEKLGFCMLLKTDGNGLYATKDMELARRKFEQYDPSQSVYVVDMRQELHFKQVFTVLKKVGFPQADRCFHLKYNFVELPDGAMSSRKGNIVPIMTLIQAMRAHVVETYLSRYANEWSKAEIDAAADIVAQGAIKYGMNVMDPNKKIVFKMEDWLRLDGESGPYIQYAHARVQSLLEKIPASGGPIHYELLNEEIEQELMIKLARFNRVMESCASSLKTSVLCGYLYDTAKLFNSFYHDCPIGKLTDAKHRDARLALAKAAGLVLKTGLEQLGIPAPNRM